MIDSLHVFPCRLSFYPIDQWPTFDTSWFRLNPLGQRPYIAGFIFLHHRIFYTDFCRLLNLNYHQNLKYWIVAKFSFEMLTDSFSSCLRRVCSIGFGLITDLHGLVCPVWFSSNLCWIPNRFFGSTVWRVRPVCLGLIFFIHPNLFSGLNCLKRLPYWMTSNHLLRRWSILSSAMTYWS